MGIIVYQILIALAIFIIGSFGTKARNTITIFLCVFTIFQVFMMWLAILQFATIFIAYQLSTAQEEKDAEIKKLKAEDRKLGNLPKNNNSYIFIFIIIIAIVCVISVSKNRNNFKSHPDVKENEPIVNDSNLKSTIHVYDDSELLQNYDTINSQVFTDEVEQNYNVNDEIEDPYASDYNGTKIIYGDFDFYRNINQNEIENGKLITRIIDESKFYFKLTVENNSSTGEISGIAIFLNSTTAVFSKTDCTSINFEFLNQKEVKVFEDDCTNYHGARIGFDAIFKQ